MLHMYLETCVSIVFVNNCTWDAVFRLTKSGFLTILSRHFNFFREIFFLTIFRLFSQSIQTLFSKSLFLFFQQWRKYWGVKVYILLGYVVKQKSFKYKYSTKVHIFPKHPSVLWSVFTLNDCWAERQSSKCSVFDLNLKALPKPNTCVFCPTLTWDVSAMCRGQRPVGEGKLVQYWFAQKELLG